MKIYNILSFKPKNVVPITLASYYHFVSVHENDLLHSLSDIRFIRRLQRDIATRGRSMDHVINQYLTEVRASSGAEFAD